MAMSVNLSTELAGTRGSGGSLSGSDGRPSASLTITLTADGATDPDEPDPESTDCSGGPLAPKWYNPESGAWDAAVITVYPSS